MNSFLRNYCRVNQVSQNHLNVIFKASWNDFQSMTDVVETAMDLAEEDPAERKSADFIRDWYNYSIQ